jgi:hypothetical protein
LLFVLVAAGLWWWKAAGASLLPGPGDGPDAIYLKPLAWATLEENDFYELSRDSGRVVVRSSSTRCCLETHRPRTDRYRMRMSADLQHDFGSAGLALGIHQTGHNPVQYRCWTAYVSRNFPQPGTWLTIEDCVLGMNEVRHLDFRQRQTLAHVKLDDHGKQDFQLEAVVDHRHMAELRYNGRLVPGLDAVTKELTIPAATSCGIVALSHVVFYSIQCQDLPP